MARLILVCGVCGTPNGEGRKVCFACGSSLCRGCDDCVDEIWED